MLDAARRQKILAKHEAALRRALSESCTRDQLVAAAERVRRAKLSLFKGQREIAQYLEQPTSSERKHLMRLAERELDWRKRTVNEILEEYS